MDSKPLVSICCTTYNHEPFIRDTIEAFLSQKGNFHIEILINDDASTDGTPSILREYEKRYPDLIKVVYQVENQYSKGIVPLVDLLFPRVKGKYVAICEGDDQWVDENKLHRQVDYMESNSQCVITSGNFIKKYESKTITPIDREKSSGTESQYGISGFVYTIESSYDKWFTKTLTVVFRSDMLRYLGVLNRYEYVRDIHIFYHILKMGQGYYFNEVLGIYNVHPGGVHSLADAKLKNIRAYLIALELYEVNKDEYTRRRLMRASYNIIRNRKKLFPNNNRVDFCSVFKKSLMIIRNTDDAIMIAKSYIRSL